MSAETLEKKSLPMLFLLKPNIGLTDSGIKYTISIQ